MKNLENLKGAIKISIAQQKNVKGGFHPGGGRHPIPSDFCDPLQTCCHKENGIWVPGYPCA